MYNKIKFIGVLAFTIFLSACSYEYKLQVVNYSIQPLTITYKIKEKSEFQKPQILSLEEWKNGKEAKDLAAEAFTTDAGSRTRTVTLGPNQVVILEKGLWDPNAENGMMNTIELKLSGTNGEMNYLGNKFYKNLEKENSAFYTIEYK